MAQTKWGSPGDDYDAPLPMFNSKSVSAYDIPSGITDKDPHGLTKAAQILLRGVLLAPTVSPTLNTIESYSPMGMIATILTSYSQNASTSDQSNFVTEAPNMTSNQPPAPKAFEDKLQLSSSTSAVSGYRNDGDSTAGKFVVERKLLADNKHQKLASERDKTEETVQQGNRMSTATNPDQKGFLVEAVHETGAIRQTAKFPLWFPDTSSGADRHVPSVTTPIKKKPLTSDEKNDIIMEILESARKKLLSPAAAAAVDRSMAVCDASGLIIDSVLRTSPSPANPRDKTFGLPEPNALASRNDSKLFDGTDVTPKSKPQLLQQYTKPNRTMPTSDASVERQLRFTSQSCPTADVVNLTSKVPEANDSTTLWLPPSNTNRKFSGYGSKPLAALTLQRNSSSARVGLLGMGAPKSKKDPFGPSASGKNNLFAAAAMEDELL